MSRDIIHQTVTAASSSPEVVKAVGILGAVGNGLLWVADHANALVAIATLIIMLLTFYHTRKKLKAETRLAEINAELAEMNRDERRNNDSCS